MQQTHSMITRLHLLTKALHSTVKGSDFYAKTYDSWTSAFEALDAVFRRNFRDFDLDATLKTHQSVVHFYVFGPNSRDYNIFCKHVPKQSPLIDIWTWACRAVY